MMSELLKLKLEELTFDIALLQRSASLLSNLIRMLKLSHGGKESYPVDLLSKSRPSNKPKPEKEAKPSEKKGRGGLPA